MAPLSRSGNAISAGYRRFSLPLSFSALVQGDSLRIHGKALRFLKLNPVFQAANGANLVILACAVFDLSTRVTKRRTELRWLRRATAIAAVARKNLQAGPTSPVEGCALKSWSFSGACTNLGRNTLPYGLKYSLPIPRSVFKTFTVKVKSWPKSG